VAPTGVTARGCEVAVADTTCTGTSSIRDRERRVQRRMSGGGPPGMGAAASSSRRTVSTVCSAPDEHSPRGLSDLQERHAPEVAGTAVTGQGARGFWRCKAEIGRVAESPQGDGPRRSHFRVGADSLPRHRQARVNQLVKWGAGGFTHVLRGRDVRNSLWETGWTLPRPGRIGADQV
jgi:hypothetical protein